MENKTKRYLNTLAEKFNHIVVYDKEALLISDALNKIRIERGSKNNLIVSYNQKNKVEVIEILEDDIFDILLQLFWRKDLEEIQPKESAILTWELFQEIELEAVFWDKYLLKLKQEINEKGIKNKELGGNRILIEYYNGLLIMVDDLGFYKANVFEL